MSLELKKFQTEVHELAKDKGWYFPPKSDLEALMLVVSEITEAAEHIRSGTEELHFHADGKPDGLGVELADAVLRILDYAEYKNIDLEYLIKIKHEYNKTRPFRHGKKI